jgi:hypothetical protein
MSNGSDWTNFEKKGEAVYKVLRYLAAHPDEGLPCVGDDKKAREFFQEKGGIDVPEDARVIFFPPGEEAKQYGGSVIIEVPAAPIPSPTDLQLKGYIVGNYPYWPPN